VVYRGTAQHTLGDFLPAAYSRYLRLLRQAKGAASSWSDQEALDRFEEIESVASQCYSRTQAEQWVTNKGLHYDAWYIMEAADLRDVVDAFRDLCDVFQCPDCGALLSVSVAGFEPDSVTCSCKKKFWNLAKKKP
jgi:hypothetical protein